MWKYNIEKTRNFLKNGNILRKAYASNVKTATVEQDAQNQPPPIDIASTVCPPTTSIPKTSTVVVPKAPELKKKLILPPEMSSDPNICSFEVIPGPLSLKYISKFWGYVPMLSTEFTAGTLFQIMNLGKFFGNLLSWGGNARFFQKFFNVYGPVVRLHGPFGGDVVLLSRPEHASIVFQHEGSQPIRSCLDSVEKYRLDHRRLRQAGPFIMSGPEWEKIHKTMEKPLQSSVSDHFKTIEKTCDEFVARIITIRNLQDEMPKTFKDEILKWCLECMCSVTLNRKFGFLDPTGLSPTSDPGRILDGVNGATAAIRKCEFGFHIWKFMETPAWKSLVKNCDSIDSVLCKYVERAQTSLREKKDLKPTTANLTVIESLLIKDDILVEDVMTVLLDMLLIGANATAHSVAFLLYHLAKAPRCQKKLFDEISKLPNDLSVGTLQKMPYLQACLKESLRLKPPIPILNRVLNEDTIIHKYFIPKGTYVLIAAHLASLREEYFDDAQKFNPERWFLPEVSPLAKELQAFATMPFGHGPKACQAKELAEIEIGLLTVKVLKKFWVEYNYGEIESSNKMLASPTKPLNFRFVDRV